MTISLTSRSLWCCLLALCALSGHLAAAPIDAAQSLYGAVPKPPQRLENFRLLDHQGFSRELFHQQDAKAMVIIGHFVGCPSFSQQADTLKAAITAHADQGAAFWLINPKEADSPAKIDAEMQQLGLELPVMRDTSQNIARHLGLNRTCEAVICAPQDNWRVVWRGSMDALDAPLKAVLNGETAPESQEVVEGCPLPYDHPGEISYLEHIAPILMDKCVNCHTGGGIGPFAMNSHQRVQGWAEMMRETIRTGLMPPWHADPNHNSFANSRALAPDEQRTLLAWLEAGAPWDGEGTDPLRVAYEESAGAEKWVMGEPDLLLQLPFEQHIKKSGVEDYRYITAATNLTEDQWVRGIEVRPTNRAVVHHVLIFVIYPPEYAHIQPNARSGLGGFYAAYLPGSLIRPFPKGYAQFLPAGSSFVFQMHYSTTGKEEIDQTKMALYFTDETPEMAVHVRAASETDFSIPPNEADWPARADFRFRQDATLLAMAPHMHFRGKRMRFTAQYPDGGEQVLLSVPNFVFDWQPMYTLDRQIPMPEGTRILCEGAFDNSRFNPLNPNPNQWVRFGEQSFEEMFIGYIQYAVPYNPDDFAPREAAQRSDGEKPLTTADLVGTKWNLYRFTLEFQENGELLISNQYKGKWTIKDDHNIYVESGLRNIYLAIVNNRLSFMGNPLRRIE